MYVNNYYFGDKTTTWSEFDYKIYMSPKNLILYSLYPIT